MLPMLKTILASLFKSPATIQFPYAERQNPGPLRGHVAIKIDQCIFCGICGRGCPSGAIAVDRPGKAWTIDPFGCVVCGYCVKACPKKCLEMKSQLSRAGKRMVREERPDARVSDNL